MQHSLSTTYRSLTQRRYGMLAVRWCVYVVALLAGVAALLGIPARLHEITKDGAQPAVAYAVLGCELLLLAVFFGAALLIVHCRARHWCAWLLGLTLIALGATETNMTDALINPEYSSLAHIWHWPILVLRAVAMIGGLLLLYVFPDGRWTPRWTLPLAATWTMLTIGWLLIPSLPFNTIYGPTWRATPTTSLLVGLGWFGTGIVAQMVRYRHAADRVQRQQIKWTMTGLIGAVLGGASYYGVLVLQQYVDLWGTLGDAGYFIGRQALQTGLMALLPLRMGVAMLRYHLFNIDSIINRTLVYVALTLCSISIYALSVGIVSVLIGSAQHPFTTFIAAGAVAVVFQPVRVRLQRSVNRLMYGDRDDPYAALSRFGQRLEHTLTVDSVVPTIIEQIAHSLRVPYVALTLAARTAAQPNVVAHIGTCPAYAPVMLPLVYQEHHVGALYVAPRSRDEPLNRTDLRILKDLACQAGVALYAVQQTRHAAQLAADLHHAYEQLISARQSERQRIRRDLHDGLGPALASLPSQLDAVADELAFDSTAATSMLTDLKQQTQHLIADVRRLVYDLRPPMLDEVGLAAALCLLIEHSSTSTTQFTLELPPDLPALPRLDVAVYRIVAEAVTNVIRHAHARHCTVRLMLTEQLHLTIEDDGRGFTAQSQPGVGLRSMCERAHELGGTWTVMNTHPGTCIAATLPLHQPERNAHGIDSDCVG